MSGVGSSYAALTEDRVAVMENRVQYLEQRIQSQDVIIGQAQRTSNNWIENIELAGLVEVEQGTSSTEGEADENDISIATVELGLAASINSWTQAELVLLYEDSGETALDVDSATITLADPNSNWSVTAGHSAVPFGVFDSNLVSDPLTLELGETVEDIVQFAIENGGVGAGVYLFNGDIDEGKDEINSFGAFLSYQNQSRDSSFAASLGYLNNMSDTDSISALNDDTGNISDHVAGVYVAINYSKGPFGLITEYLGATDEFAANTLATTSSAASPSATHVELGYNFRISGKTSTLAMSVQGTDEAESIGLPESKVLVDLTVDLMENMMVSVEYASEEDYIGTENNAITVQLAVEF